MRRKSAWNDEQLHNAVARCSSMRAVLVELGIKPMGGNYVTVRRRIASLGLSTSHWVGQAWLRGKHIATRPARTLDEILKPGAPYPTFKLKARLLRAGVLEAKCSRCVLSEWMSAPIPLELDHVDGDSANNSLANLRLLCPNCHAQTPTYRAKNARYPHIPPSEVIEAGIASAGSIAKYATALAVSEGSVRGWLRSARLRRMGEVRENRSQYVLQ